MRDFIWLARYVSRSSTGMGRRRHYRLIASALHRVWARNDYDPRTLDAVLEELIDALHADHPGFDRSRFRRWVRFGPEPGAAEIRARQSSR